MTAELVPFPAGPGAELAELGLSEEQLAGAFELFRRMQAMESAKAAKLPAHATNERLIADWFAHHRTDWTVETQRSRRSQITQLAAFLEPTPLLLATEDELLAFRDSRECGADALAGLVSCVRGFYHWVTVVRRLRAGDPAAALQRPKVPKRRKSRRVAEPELRLVEEVARDDPQMRAWLLLLGHHGFRVSDVSRLNVEDITEDGSVEGIAGWARLVGKGDVVRRVPLAAETMAALAPFMKGKRKGPVFTRRDGKRHTANAVSKTVNTFLRDCGVDRTAHGLRHRFATQYSRVDADPRNLQVLLGHADLGTTMIYTELEPEAAAAGVAALAEKTRRVRAGDPAVLAEEQARGSGGPQPAAAGATAMTPEETDRFIHAVAAVRGLPVEELRASLVAPAAVGPPGVYLCGDLDAPFTGTDTAALIDLLCRAGDLLQSLECGVC